MKKIFFGVLSCVFALSILTACNTDNSDNTKEAEDDNNTGNEVDVEESADTLNNDIKDKGIDEEKDPKDNPEDVGEDQDNKYDQTR
ncbi:hypothetical protein [Virgibacillus ainsalahensis]